MNREQSAFLLGGVVFGLVAGLLLGFVFFKPGAIEAPPANAVEDAAPSRGTASETPAPATGGMDPGAAMGTVMQEIASLKATLEKDPNNVDALVRLGDMYFDAQKFDQSMQYYERASAARPKDPQILTALGLCLLNMNQPDKALAKCREAVQAQPDYWPAVAYTVIAAVELNDAGLAKESLARLKALNPTFEHLKEFEDRVTQMGSSPARAGG